MAALGTKLAVGTAKTATRLGGQTMVLASRAQPHMKTFWGHAKVELSPPSPAQWPEVKKGFSQVFQSAVTGKFLNLTVKEASKKALVGVEIVCWFFVGEMIGRRSIVGYKV